MAAPQIPAEARRANRARTSSPLVAALTACLGFAGASTACSAADTRASHERVLARASETAVAPPASAPPISTEVPTSNPVTPPPAHEGKNFAEEVKLLYRVAACQGDGPVPADLDADTVESYCKELRTTIDKYRKRYVSVAAPFLHNLLPPNVPTTVVYPFSGGDLVTAMTTYPDALDFTTLSLELPGDPRRLKGISKATLAKSLKRLRVELGELFDFDDFSRSETLKNTQRGEVPGELAFFLVGLAVHGYEPLSLRYFKFTPEGDLYYFDEQEIASREAQIAEKRKGTWTPPDFSETFANAEITFRKVGDPNAPIHTHRHIAVNLADDQLSATPGVVKYLEKKGKVAAMVKAASYLLWTDAFAVMRNYLMKNAVFTVSDSTGIPPQYASEAGLVQETYGSFSGSLLPAANDHNQAFKNLWKSQPKRSLPFRFGYRDRASKNHLLVTRTTEMAMPSGAAPSAPPSAPAPPAAPHALLAPPAPPSIEPRSGGATRGPAAS